MLLYILIALLVLNAAVLIIAILLQPRGPGGLSAAFGGGGYVGAIFGGRGGLDFLTKLTAVLALIFVVLILVINVYISSPRAPKSLMKREVVPTAPAGQTQTPTQQGGE